MSLRLFQRVNDVREGLVRRSRSVADPGVWALATRRFGRWTGALPVAPLRWAGSKVYGGMLMAVQISTGNVVYREAGVGQNLDMHGARNVLIHPDVQIGDRCHIGSGVTLGTNGRFKAGAPTLGDDVVVESGAKILGPVKIGDGAVIRANSLVFTDVPAGAVAMGVPARYARPGAPVVPRAKVEARGS